MTDHKHPLRDIGVSVYQRIGDDGGPAFIAKFIPYGAYPIFFRGETADDAIASARGFADEAVAKHEAAYAARMDAMIERRAAKAKKDAAK